MPEMIQLKEDTNYYITSEGDLYSLKRHKYLKLPINEKGYYYFRRNNKGPKLKIHRLVAQYFLYNNDPNKTVVHHINNNKLDNRKDNLIWVTPEEHTILHFGNNKK